MVTMNQLKKNKLDRLQSASFSRQELLKESYRLMEIRKLLRGYGIRNFNLSNCTQIMVCSVV